MKGYEVVKELLESELDDYCFFEVGEIKVNTGYDQSEEDEYYEVEIKKGNDEKETLCFHYNRKEDKLEIEMSDCDTLEEAISYFEGIRKQKGLPKTQELFDEISKSQIATLFRLLIDLGEVHLKDNVIYAKGEQNDE